jgi:hypothetical protein
MLYGTYWCYWRQHAPCTFRRIFALHPFAFTVRLSLSPRCDPHRALKEHILSQIPGAGSQQAASPVINQSAKFAPTRKWVSWGKIY